MNHHIPIYIAIADDHKAVRTGVASYLEAEDRNLKVFIQADNGKDLVEKIAKAPHQPDVCIIDVNMREMDGYETTIAVKEKYPCVHCMAFTTYGTAEYTIIKMLHNGCSGFITKDSDPAELAKAVRIIYEGGFYLSQEVHKRFPGITRGGVKELAKKLLTPTEVEFLKWFCTDLNMVEIAARMHVSHRTVENQCDHIKKKLGIHTRTGLVKYAGECGFTPPHK